MAENLEVPRHLGIIPDGNRRWARQRGWPVIEGHRRGYQVVREVARTAMDAGVEFVSVYGFSTENWKRDKKEVAGLMKLLKWIADHEVKNIDKEDIRVRFAGREDGLDPKIVRALRDAEERTMENTRGQLVMCINYGGQTEIVDAMQAMATAVVKGELSPDEIDRDTVAGNLYLPDVPEMDMMLRTSGEQRVSDFMTWQAAQAELMFSDKLWPDFTPADLMGCLEEYGQRDRRLGA